MLQNNDYPRIEINRLRKFAAQSLDRSFTVSGYDVTNEQELILRNLRQHQSICQTDLARHTGQDRNNLSRTLAILERKGLVQKKNSGKDRRYCEICITSKGEKVHDELWKILEQWRAQLYSNIPVEELERFSRIAESMIDNIARMHVNSRRTV